MENNFSVKLLDKDSIMQQIHIYKVAFDLTESNELIKDYWIKKHYKNPIHPSYVFGVYDKDSLVSINAYMPMRYIYNGSKFNVIQSCESGTLPEYRGKGIWSKVVNYAISFFKEEGVYDFLIGFPNFDNSFNGFIKMNWSHDADVNNYIIIGNGIEFLKSVFNGKTLFLGKIFELQRIGLSISRIKGLNVGKVINILPLNRSGFCLDADEDFYKWKMLYKQLKQFGIRDNLGRPVANCRYFIKKYKGVFIIQLCGIDIFASDYNYKYICSMCVRILLKRHKNVAFIRSWAVKNSISEKTFKDLHFLAVNHHNPFITYQLKELSINSNVLHDQMNWINISFLDLD